MESFIDLGSQFLIGAGFGLFFGLLVRVNSIIRERMSKKSLKTKHK